MTNQEKDRIRDEVRDIIYIKELLSDARWITCYNLLKQVEDEYIDVGLGVVANYIDAGKYVKAYIKLCYFQEILQNRIDKANKKVIDQYD